MTYTEAASQRDFLTRVATLGAAVRDLERGGVNIGGRGGRGPGL